MPAPPAVQTYAAAPYAAAPAAAAPAAAAPSATASSTRGLYAIVPSARGDAAAPSTTGSFAAPPPAIDAYAAGPYAYASTVSEGPYTLDSGDRLRIVVFGQEGLTNSYSVDASGHIAMPLIGPVLARGATTDQLSSRIAEKLREGYIREPHVAVEIEAYRPFFILGEVTAPGQYPFVANMSVETAVAIAGGFTPRAFRKTVMLNRNLNGRPVRISVPVTFPLRPGDTINVQERWF
jgi:polysaccharide export outer membrane protein